MWIRRLLRLAPGLSRIADVLDTMERDHLELVAAHQTLERAYQQLVRDYRALESDYSAFRATFQRLTRPALQSGHHLAAYEPPTVVGVPVPPPLLRYWVAGHDDLGWFLASGEQGVQALQGILAPHGIQLADFARILDFGCGCGRVLRHLPAATTALLHGTDSNAEAIHWCSEHLACARFTVNSLEPPLEYADQTFDLIYAFSVFTHMTGALQRAWTAELRRCLKPGGYLVMSTHGDRYLPHLSQQEQAAYNRGELVVHHQDHFGENICSAFQSEASVCALAMPAFAIVSFVAEGALGNPHQDLYLLQVQ
jgi:SAM-dependent methyltransferase